MKHISTIFRTLCLTALLCITSVSASAYKVYDEKCDLANIYLFLPGHRILIIEENVKTETLQINNGYAVVIKPGATVEVSKTLKNNGKLYVFGTLYIESKCGVNNNSTIYKMHESALLGDVGGNISTSGAYSARKVTDGSFPVTPNSGWNNYWERGIASEGDFYPMGYFEDEACTKPITDLEAWKAAHSNMDFCLKIDGIGYDNWEYYDTDQKKGFFYGDLALEGSQSFEANDDFNVTGTFTFTRDLSFAIGKWQSWYEPFEVELTADVLTKMDVAQIAGILTDDNGNTVVAFRKMGLSETMKANTPYVIRTKDPLGSLKLEYEGGKTIYKSAEKSFKFSSMFDNFEIGGIYKASQNSDWYALSTAGAFSKLNTATLQAQRLWLTITPRTDSPYYNPTVSSKGFIGMTVLGDDETTGIAGAAKSGVRSGVIFNLKGERVTSILKGQVYIVDGKRFMAR